jgi:hypothetical protein
MPTLTVGLSLAAISTKLPVGEMAEVLRWSQTVVELAGRDPAMGNVVFGSPLAVARASRGTALWALGRAGWREDYDRALAMARGGGPMSRLPAVQHTRHGVGFHAKRKPRAASRPISARFEPVLRLRGVNHWFALAVPSGPASRTRTIWQYWRVPTSSELLPTLTGAPRIRLLPASTQPLRRPGGGGLPPPLEHQAPRGARAGRRSDGRRG